MSQTVNEDVLQICSRYNMRVEDIINFINVYRLYPCLWNPKDDNYRSRIVRKEAMNEIALLIGATPLEVEKKIAMVLAQNRRARRKAIVLRKKGMSETQIESLVWYGYKHFSYLNELHREKRDLFEQEDDFEEEERKPLPEEDSNLEDPLSLIGNDQNPSSVNGKKRRKSATDLDSVIFNTCQIIKELSDRHKDRDEEDVYGELVAHKLRKLDEKTRRELQHKINCMVFEAEMKIYDKRGVSGGDYSGDGE